MTGDRSTTGDANEVRFLEGLRPKAYDIGEILPAIERELSARLDATLSEKDWLAVRTALAKGAARGFERGEVLLAQQFNEMLESDPTSKFEGVDVETPDFGNEPDLWAEQHRDGLVPLWGPLSLRPTDKE